MADPYFVAFDPNADEGERISSPEVRAEITAIAPSAVVNGSITAAKLADDAVTSAKLADGAVTSTSIAAGQVVTDNLGVNAVTTAKIADGAVTAAKAGAGIMKVKDSAGNNLTRTVVEISVADYAALSSPDPNTWYATF